MTILTTQLHTTATSAACWSGMCGLLGLAAAGPALGADSFDGVYSDKRVLTKGSTQQCIH